MATDGRCDMFDAIDELVFEAFEPQVIPGGSWSLYRILIDMRSGTLIRLIRGSCWEWTG